MIGVIGGSGFYEMEGAVIKDEISLDTPYGKPSSYFEIMEFGGKDMVFLNRHGKKHSFPPHMVNYRANLYGLKELGVKEVLSFSAAGGINKTVGVIVIPDNAIDMTSGRASTYSEEGRVFHVDLTSPFCPDMRRRLMMFAEDLEIPVSSGVYVCTNGPRLETAAEIRMYERIGADIVGMTLFPECVLARELGICFANISVVTNFAAGVANDKLSSGEVLANMEKHSYHLQSILTYFLNSVQGGCGCSGSLDGAGMGQ